MKKDVTVLTKTYTAVHVVSIYTKDCRHIAYTHKIHLKMILFIFQIWKPPWLVWLYDIVTAIKSYGVHRCDIYDVFSLDSPFLNNWKNEISPQDSIYSTKKTLQIVISNISIISFMPKSKEIPNLLGPSTCHRHWRDQFSKLLTPHLSVIIHLATLGFPRVPEKHPEKRDVGTSLEHHDQNTVKLGKRE